MAVREVREDVREEMERALSGTQLPAQQRQEVVTKIGAAVERYISPYVHPEVMAQIETLAPGSATQIVQASIETIRHNNDIEKIELSLREQELSLVRHLASEDFSSLRQGRSYGLFAFVCVLIFSGVMYYLGAEKLSYVAFGVGSLGIVGQLITGGRKVSIKTEPPEPELDEKPKQEVTKPK